MKSKIAPAIVAVTSLIVVGAVAWWAFREKTSPGPLHPSHAAIAELRGGQGCRQCHGPSRAGMSADCGACHEPVAAQIAQGVGLHGRLDKTLSSECQSCHRDHLGAEVALVSAAAFELAGVPDVEKYDHTQTGPFNLTGRHAELTCAACHPRIRAISLAKGEHRFAGLTQACTQCHPDEHKGELGADCASCHGQSKPFKESPEFKHPDTFPLIAGHGGRRCSECHTTPHEFKGLKTECVACHQSDYDKTAKPSHLGAGLTTACAECHGVEAWDKDVRYQHPSSFPLAGGHDASCTACHTSPTPQRLQTACISCHRETYDKTTKPPHALAKLDTRCEQCHGVDDWCKPVKFTHPDSFPLIGGHEKSECTACHQAGQVQQRMEAFTTDRSCASCHDSPHSKTLESLSAAMLRSDLTSDTCIACHAPSDRLFTDADARMTLEVHAVTGFPLTPPHQIAECAKCHAIPAGAPQIDKPERWKRLYPGRPAEECRRCHEDPHKGQFSESASAGRCRACHEPERFAPSTFDAAAHDGCGFPLTGGHRAVACASCHKVVDGVRRFVPTPTACSECHKDVHEGQFDRQGLASVVNGKSGCERCHTTDSFSKTNWTPAEHERWSGYALTGKHAQAACRDCHARPVGTPHARPPASARVCADCHADPHAGQFRPGEGDAAGGGRGVGGVGGVTDCVRCHSDTTSFKALSFDHQRDARLALDADHAKLACIACHKPYPIPGSTGTVVRYKPLGVTCADCHDSRREDGGTRP